MMPTNNETPAIAATTIAATTIAAIVLPDETLIQNNQYAYVVRYFHQQLDLGVIRSGINTKEKESVVHLFCKPGETWMTKIH